MTAIHVFYSGIYFRCRFIYIYIYIYVLGTNLVNNYQDENSATRIYDCILCLPLYLKLKVVFHNRDHLAELGLIQTKQTRSDSTCRKRCECNRGMTFTAGWACALL